MKKLILTITVLYSLASCIKTNADLQSQDDLTVKSDDIIVLSQGTRSVIQLDHNGQYIDTLYVAPTGSSLKALTWDRVNNRALVGYTYNATTKIISITPSNKGINDFSVNAFLTATLNTLVPTVNGFLFSATPNIIRKLNYNGAYNAGSGFPLNIGPTGSIVQMATLANNQFLVCSSTSPYIKIFNSNGVEQLSASNITPPSQATTLTGCNAISTGQIAISWSGTNDTVAVYNPNNFSTALYQYTDTAILAAPKWIQKASNGNVLIGDTSFNHIVELTPKMEFVRTLGASYFSTPVQFIAL